MKIRLFCERTLSKEHTLPQKSRRTARILPVRWLEFSVLCQFDILRLVKRGTVSGTKAKPSVWRARRLWCVRRTQCNDAPAGPVFYPPVISSAPKKSMAFASDTRLRRGFFLARGRARWSLVARRSTRQNRSASRLILRKERPAASTACMADVRASTGDERLALVRVSNSCRSSPFKGWRFAATILARHFPGSCSNAVISSPLYCIARPRCVLIAGRKGEQGLAAYLKKNYADSPRIGF